MNVSLVTLTAEDDDAPLYGPRMTMVQRIAAEQEERDRKATAGMSLDEQRAFWERRKAQLHLIGQVGDDPLLDALDEVLKVLGATEAESARVLFQEPAVLCATLCNVFGVASPTYRPAPIRREQRRP